ncbi:hypothetical protein [Arthrobacter sp. H14]|uniref:hypothetical protein n=1 Tax=Arthrobacter sp. H14 TaxID=1312959 RepID=UPI00047EE69C|nr:hypothetical protein [Arthrobacter sp. H14]
MDPKKLLGAVAVASLLMTGCAATASDSPESPSSPASHSMADGTEMSGAEHGEHQPEHQNAQGPSEAARMVCNGQVVQSVSDVLGLESELTPSSSWDKPMFTCTYDVDGKPLVFSVHDATNVAEGKKHFAELQKSTDNAEDIKGMLGLGMPSFSTGDGIVAFLRDGKTLLVDATALPVGLGPNGSKTQHDAAYALASAVLVCWVDHT